MMKIKKILVAGIILLFLGVTVAPSINQSVVIASQEDNLIEVTMQVFGIPRFRDTTMKLTKSQYQNLEQYLFEFRARLNQTTTREEAAPLFEKAVVELDKYKLLPKGMSAKKIQHLMINPLQNTASKKISRLQKNAFFDNSYNSFCLVSARVTYPGYWHIDSMMIPLNLILLGGLAFAWLLSTFGARNAASLLSGYSLLLSLLNPVRFMNLILFMYCEFDIQTIGFKGFIQDDSIELDSFVGYTGLMLWGQDHETYFLGSALQVI